jgi:hypothetical protein
MFLFQRLKGFGSNRSGSGWPQKVTVFSGAVPLIVHFFLLQKLSSMDMGGGSMFENMSEMLMDCDTDTVR